MRKCDCRSVRNFAGSAWDTGLDCVPKVKGVPCGAIGLHEQFEPAHSDVITGARDEVDRTRTILDQIGGLRGWPPFSVLNLMRLSGEAAAATAEEKQGAFTRDLAERIGRLR